MLDDFGHVCLDRSSDGAVSGERGAFKIRPCKRHDFDLQLVAKPGSLLQGLKTSIFISVALTGKLVVFVSFKGIKCYKQNHRLMVKPADKESCPKLSDANRFMVFNLYQKPYSYAVHSKPPKTDSMPRKE